MSNKNFLLLTLALLVTFNVNAQIENKQKKEEEKNVDPTKVSSELPVLKPAKTEDDEADRLITNRRLRADIGSLSTWSVSTSFNYQGGSLADPTDPTRPNIVKGADALTLQNFTGDIGARYRVTKLFSLTGSIGLFMTTPFHDSIDTDNAKLQRQFDENHQKLTVNDPMLKAAYVNKISFIQSVSTAKLTLITNNQQKLDGYQWSYYLSQDFMYKVDGSRLSYGAKLSGQFYSFSKQNDALTDSVLGVYPALEYELTDRLIFRTVLGQWVYQHIRAEDTWTYEKRKVYQSVGLGINLGRDVFLYPNVQFIPSDIRSDRTNIALSANINIF